MKQILTAAIASIAALAAQASISTTDLKTLAETVIVEGDSAGTYVNVLGTGDAKPGNQWAWTKDVVFDDHVHLANNAWFEPTYNGAASGENAWAGIHLTTPAIVHTIRYYARNDGSEYAARAIGCQFQGANAVDSNGEFQDPVTLYTIPVTDLDTLTNGWQEVTISDPALLAQAFTYLRVIGSYGGNFAEVEFYGQTWAEATSGTPSVAPQNLTISSVNADTDAVTLTWDAPTEPCRSAKVIRSTAPGGSTFDVTLATLSATTLTYTDSDADRIPGVTYYYRVAFANSDENIGPASAAVAHRHVSEISFDSSTMTAVEYHHDYGTESATAGAANLFDGKTDTYPDVVNTDGGNEGVAVGVDFGEGNEYVINGFKVFPSREWNGTLNKWVVGRSDGIVLNGSNDTVGWQSGAAISDVCDLYKENTWDDTQLSWSTFETTVTNAYRYVYLTKPARENLTAQRTNDFFGNVRELKLYGWNVAAAANVLTEPKDAAAAWKGSHVDLTWTAVAEASTYRVERRTDGGAWEVVATDLTACAYRDNPAHPTQATYAYRVGAVDNSGRIAYTIALVPAGTPAPHGIVIIIR